MSACGLYHLSRFLLYIVMNKEFLNKSRGSCGFVLFCIFYLFDYYLLIVVGGSSWYLAYLRLLKIFINQKLLEICCVEIIRSLWMKLCFFLLIEIVNSLHLCFTSILDPF